MNETILGALMRLFAIIANVEKEGVSQNARTIVESYLSLLLSKENALQYLQLFDNYIEEHHKNRDSSSVKVKKRTSLNSVKVLKICNEINEELQQEEKVIVLLRLFEFIREDESITDEELDFIHTVADTFNISNEEYHQIKYLIIGNINEITDKLKVLIIDNNPVAEISQNDETPEKFRTICEPHLNGQINMLYIKSTNTFVFRYEGEQVLYLNSHNITPHRTYVFDDGSVIKSPKISPIYHSDIAGKFIHSLSKTKIIFSAKDIEYRFKGSENGIHKFNFIEQSGRLIGIMGGSGVGKSTLLNLLNGNYRPNSGQITINGYDIHNDKDKLKGVIGFVPQDDLLIEELTVFQNLYYNAKLCFSKFTEQQILEAVENVLSDLDLEPTRDLTVGGVLNKFISGGQRKRLNIALELIREPSILIVDEPTSGLSSMDSDMVMSLLKEQTLKGKLVIVNIHQPSSDIYKLFDRLLMLDRGGYPVFYGNPIDALSYFKKAANFAGGDQSECVTCGNVNPELPLQILEARVVDEHGRFTKERKIAPQEWYSAYKEKIDPKRAEQIKDSEKSELPENYFNIPSRFKQFRIFAIRNILSKFTNKQYLLITFLEAPLLAVILGYFSKYISGTDLDPNAYVFAENVNLPAYLFMAVTVALFFGMTLSAEEIIKDRTILKREKFLNLSKISYLNSKIFVLLIISAIQTLSFIVVGNFVLDIHGMTMNYWIVLFTAAAFANILGLNISASLDSVVTIYITIPFILVPQLLFSGTIVDFTKLHRRFTTAQYVPVIGDLMTSRWAYEALAVTQFKDNEYEKQFFEADKEKSEVTFKLSYLLPELETYITKINSNLKNNENQKQNHRLLTILYNECEEFEAETDKKFKLRSKLNSKNYDENIGIELNSYFRTLKNVYANRQYEANKNIDVIFNNMIKIHGSKEAVFELKNLYSNKRLADVLQNKTDLEFVKEENGRLIQMKDPIFKEPSNRFGRAHFYAPLKKVGNLKIDTFWFNILFIWITNFMIYLTLAFDVFRKIIEFKRKKYSNN